MQASVDDPQDFPRRCRRVLAARAPCALGRGARPAAVLMALTPVARGWRLIFTRRSDDLPHHGGEICFPGGGLRPAESPREAALREAREEIGLDPRLVEVLGFGGARRTGSGHVVVPVVARLLAPPRLTPCPREVAEIFSAPLAHFLDPANYRRERRFWRGAWRDYWVVRWKEREIWGATAGMLRDFMRRVRGEGHDGK